MPRRWRAARAFTVHRETAPQCTFLATRRLAFPAPFHAPGHCVLTFFRPLSRIEPVDDFLLALIDPAEEGFFCEATSGYAAAAPLLMDHSRLVTFFSRRHPAFSSPPLPSLSLFYPSCSCLPSLSHTLLLSHTSSPPHPFSPPSSPTSNCSANCVEPSPTFLDATVSANFGFPNNNASQTPVDLTSSVTKVDFYFGLPLAGYANEDDRYDEQIGKIEDFVKRTKDIIESADGKAGLSTGYISDILLTEYFFDIVITDVALVVIAIVIVGAYIGVYLQSLFLASLGMLHVLLSFPLAYLTTQILMDFNKLGILTLMALFIILGIGADGVSFVAVALHAFRP